MQINDFLNDVCRQIKYKPIREEIAQEIKSHVEESKENYMEKGIQEKEAEEKAILQMGNAEEIGKKLNKIHKPKFNLSLFIIVSLLLGFGILVNSLNYANEYFIILILSVLVFCLIYFFDYRKLMKYSNFIYAIPTIILLFARINKSRDNF